MMLNPETLLVAELQNYHQWISRSKIWGISKFDFYNILFMEINRKKLNIWQTCDAKSGNPFRHRALKVSPIYFLCQNMGHYITNFDVFDIDFMEINGEN